MTPSPASLLAGATLPHGRHERRGASAEGWDPVRRRHAHEEPDVLVYGRHAALIETRPLEKT